MNKKNNFYCRLENFCCHFLQNETTTVKEKSWDMKTEDVYVQYFTDINSLKKRVLQLYQIWMNKHDFYNRPEKVYYPGFMIFNQYKDCEMVGFCPQGWYFSSGCFGSYICKYVKALGSDEFSRNMRKIWGRGYDFDVSVDCLIEEINLLSDELMDIELKHFLDGEEITNEIRQNVYYPEMVRRGYINILRKK